MTVMTGQHPYIRTHLPRVSNSGRSQAGEKSRSLFG